MEAVSAASSAAGSQGRSLQRRITWKGAFWVASGVPALVLFSIGAVAATVGKVSWLAWTVSIAIGFMQAFTYAEIAGLYPGKAGGVSNYGAFAWVRYTKLVAPLSVWCYWFAWSPIIAIGVGLASGYILTALFAADSVINTWQLTLVDLSAVKAGLVMRINATWLLGAVILLATFVMQHGGIQRSARVSYWLAVVSLVPLLLIGVVPILTGDMPLANFTPMVPLAHDAAGNAIDGTWNMAGWTLLVGGIFIAGWSTYGFEIAVCYTRELKDPKTDTYKALMSCGLLCLAAYTLIPAAFQGHLGLSGMLAPDIYSGMGVAAAMSDMLGKHVLIEQFIVVMLVLSLVLAIVTTMAGSSRTLYQASVDGWLPRYLSHLNSHGVPTAAMWTDLCFNLVLLTLSDYVFVIAASNVGYMMFHFINLQSGWIHRMDRADWERPYKAPTWLIGLGAILGFANLGLMGWGADVYGAGALKVGLLFLALVFPIFIYRHYYQDRGVFPEAMADDMVLSDDRKIETRAGVLPYLALVAGAIIIFIAHKIAVY